MGNLDVAIVDEEAGGPGWALLAGSAAAHAVKATAR
jgi:hypothetical protein